MNTGYTGRTATINKVGRTFEAVTNEGEIVTDEISTVTRTKAFRAGVGLAELRTKSGRLQWRLSDDVVTTTASTPATPTVAPADAPVAGFNMSVINVETQEELIDFLHKKALKLRPEGLVISDLKWKFLMRNVLRGENLLMTGPSGCGKTLAAQSVSDAFPGRRYFYFNLGATQDPRSTLIGNTHFNQGSGTFFSESHFVQAIRTPGAIILLDELSRAHPEAWNILMTVLDRNQRYLRLDEASDSPTVKVADGVTFIGTANIGSEYTSTRTMDRALMDRFVTVEMEPLNAQQELGLLQYMFPTVRVALLKAVSEIAHHTREQMKGGAGRLSAMISTRASVQLAGLLQDGFSLEDAAEVAIFPFFDADGGLDSERTYVKQLVQKHIPPPEKESTEGLFDGAVKQHSSNHIPF